MPPVKVLVASSTTVPAPSTISRTRASGRPGAARPALIGDHIVDRQRLVGGRRKGDRLVALDEDATAIGGTIAGVAGAQHRWRDRAARQAAALDRQAAALLHEDVAAGPKTAATASAAGINEFVEAAGAAAKPADSANEDAARPKLVR